MIDNTETLETIPLGNTIRQGNSIIDIYSNPNLIDAGITKEEIPQIQTVIKQLYLRGGLIRIISRCPDNPNLVIMHHYGKSVLVLMLLGQNPIGFPITNNCDRGLLWDGELIIDKNVSWHYTDKLCVFYKKYLVHNIQSKVVVDFGNPDDIQITETQIVHVFDPDNNDYITKENVVRVPSDYFEPDITVESLHFIWDD